MKEYICSYLNFPKEIDITDPSYDEDVWCRINRFPISEGKYECYYVQANNEETKGWGDRIARCGIRKMGTSADHFERKGMIGVDSGLAGFFNCDNLKVFEEDIINSNANVFIGDEYFVTSSGYGDGAYDIYAGYENGKLTEVYIEFI